MNDTTTFRLIAEIRPFITVPACDLTELMFATKQVIDSPDFPSELKLMSEVIHYDLVNEMIKRN